MRWAAGKSDPNGVRETSFENPMYASSQDAGDGVYMEPAAAAASSGYMDVPAGAQGPSSGYMDVGEHGMPYDDEEEDI